MVKNSFQYHHSGLSKLFSCQKDMFYRFMEQDNIDWRKLVYMVSLRLLKRISRFMVRKARILRRSKC